MLPDNDLKVGMKIRVWSQCTYRCVVLPDRLDVMERRPPCGLNAPTGAWCSLTIICILVGFWYVLLSQCTYRCVVLPDSLRRQSDAYDTTVSMHLQVRGAP